MNQNSLLQPIRRVVGGSASNQKNSQAIQKKSAHVNNARAWRFESLEESRALSVNVVGSDGSSEPRFEEFGNGGSDSRKPRYTAISYLKVMVNGREVHRLTPDKNGLQLVSGDWVEVLEMGVDTQNETGVFAAEGYPSMIGDHSSTSLIDYNDGRFSDPSRDFVANGGKGLIRGLNRRWEVQEGWDGMVINLMHYEVETTECAAQFHVSLEVVIPEFGSDTEYRGSFQQRDNKTGDEVTLPAQWTSNPQDKCDFKECIAFESK